VENHLQQDCAARVSAAALPIIQGIVTAESMAMLTTVIICSALIVLAGVLWMRPWIDDHHDPYG